MQQRWAGDVERGDVDATTMRRRENHQPRRRRHHRRETDDENDLDDNDGVHDDLGDGNDDGDDGRDGNGGNGGKNDSNKNNRLRDSAANYNDNADRNVGLVVGGRHAAPPPNNNYANNNNVSQANYGNNYNNNNNVLPPSNYNNYINNNVVVVDAAEMAVNQKNQRLAKELVSFSCPNSFLFCFSSSPYLIRGGTYWMDGGASVQGARKLCYCCSSNAIAR